MATITVNATQDGILYGPESLTFSGARDGATAGAVAANPSSTGALSVMFEKQSKRGSTNYQFYRSAFGFNVGPYSSDTITNAKLRIRTTASGTTSTVYMVPFLGFGATLGSSLVTSDWNDFTLGTSWGSSSLTNTTTSQTITLNATGIAAFTTGYVKIGLISSVDKNNADPLASNQLDDTYINWSHADNAELEFDQASPGYGNDVNGVASANISSVIGVATADISTINGV
jgi:hypothetical protein